MKRRAFDEAETNLNKALAIRMEQLGPNDEATQLIVTRPQGLNDKNNLV